MKTLHFFFIAILFCLIQSVTNAQWSPFCRDDIAFGYMDTCNYQVVQAVWADDPNFPSPDDDLEFVGGDPERCRCNINNLKMILLKPSLIFASRHNSGNDNRDPLRLRIRNYYTIPRTFRIKFTIDEESDRVIAVTSIGWTILEGQSTTMPCIYGPGTTVIPRTMEISINVLTDLTYFNINNLPDSYFQFKGDEGTRTVRMEIVQDNANYDPFNEPNRNNQTRLLTCEAQRSHQLRFYVTPFLFLDRMADPLYQPPYFDYGQNWFNLIRDTLKYVYECYPVAYHDVTDRQFVTTTGIVRPMWQNIIGLWGSLTESQYGTFTVAQRQTLNRRHFNLFKHKLNNLSYDRILVMTEENRPGSYLALWNPPDIPAGLSFQPVVGPFGNASTNVSFIAWNLGPMGKVIAHETGHTFGYDHDLPPVRADGFRVIARQYKNNKIEFMQSVFNGGTNEAATWIRKDIYKRLADRFHTDGTLDPELIAISGTIARNSNYCRLSPFYKFMSDKINVDSINVATHRYRVTLRNGFNNIIKTYGLDAPFSKTSEIGIQIDTTYFLVNVPNRAGSSGIRKIEITDSLSNVLASRTITNNSPIITVVSPNGGEIYSRDSIRVRWTSSDLDPNDTLYHSVFIKRNLGDPWMPFYFFVRGNYFDMRSIFPPGNSYKVKVMVTDGWNTTVDSSDGFFGVIGVKILSQNVPEKFNLFQNYPNPFNPVTYIEFSVPKKSDVQIKIFDVLGREIETLVNEQLKPGTYEVDWDGSGFASGVYFYKIETGTFVETKKMVLIK